LRKSNSLLKAIALGKHIVTDEWAEESLAADHLLDPSIFVPSDPIHEEQWGFKMSNAVCRPRIELLKGKTIYLSPALKKEYGGEGFKAIEDIIKKCGATRVISGAAKDLPTCENTIFLVSSLQDSDASLLRKKGRRCYSKELISISVLRGMIDLDSHEFRLEGDRTKQ
jgi:hypothetical protein